MYIDMTEEQFRVYIGQHNSRQIIDFLMEEGLELKAPEPEISRPELFAQAAKDWIGNASGNVYQHVSGWSTASWEHVLRRQLGEKGFTLEYNVANIKDVFAATVLLAKEAGIKL